MATAARLSEWMPRLVLAPSFVISFLFIYGLMAWNGYLSLSASRLLPNYTFVGFDQYVTLFDESRSSGPAPKPVECGNTLDDGTRCAIDMHLVTGRADAHDAAVGGLIDRHGGVG